MLWSVYGEMHMYNSVLLDEYTILQIKNSLSVYENQPIKLYNCTLS